MNEHLTIKIIKNLVFALIVLLFSNCKDQKNLGQWKQANIDPDLPNDLVYKYLDTQKEIFSALEEHDTLTKRTSDVVV